MGKRNGKVFAERRSTEALREFMMVALRPALLKIVKWQPRENEDELASFFYTVRRALLQVVRWIEKKYGWQEG